MTGFRPVRDLRAWFARQPRPMSAPLGVHSKRNGPLPHALDRELAARHLTRTQVVTSVEAHDLAGVPLETGRSQGMRTLGVRLGLPMAPPSLFTIRSTNYWSRDAVEAWLAPARGRNRPPVRSHGELRAEALRRHQAGEDIPTLAEALGVRPQTAYGWVRRAGLLRPSPRRGRQPRVEPPSGRAAMAVDFYLQGDLSAYKVGELVGLSEREVLDAVRAAGHEVLPPGRRRVTA